MSTIGDVVNPSPTGIAINSPRLKNGKLPYRLHFRNGYLCVDVFRDGRRNKCYVHILVAETFLGLERDGSMVVNHKNGIKCDNRVENLEIISKAEDAQRAIESGRRKPSKWSELVDPEDGLTEAAVHTLRGLRKHGVPITQEVLDRFGVSRWVATRAATGKTWTHLNAMNDVENRRRA